MFWHDSDPGDDMIFGTADDGDVMPVTTADIEFGFNLLRYQENVRYATQWQFVYAVEPVNVTMFKVFEERRFLFAFEGHDVSMLAPKHLYEDYIFGEGNTVPTGWTDAIEIVMPCGAISHGDCWVYYSQDDSAYEHHHDEWAMWEEEYIVDPTDPAGRMLTYLIGFGPFKYHLGDWVPGDHVKFAANPTYYGGHICKGDLDFNQKCEPATVDVHDIMSSVGPRPYLNPSRESVRADIMYPAQVVELAELLAFIAHSGDYWGADPVPEGFTRCDTFGP
jgi:ABC-type transport system substrate-binding protein